MWKNTSKHQRDPICKNLSSLFWKLQAIALRWDFVPSLACVEFSRFSSFSFHFLPKFIEFKMHAWVWICAVTKILLNNYRLNQLSVMNFYYLTLEYTHADQRAEPTESIVCVYIHILFKVFIIAVFIFHVFFSSFPFSFPFSLFVALSWNAVNICWFTSHKQIRKNECSVHLDDAAWKIVAARFLMYFIIRVVYSVFSRFDRENRVVRPCAHCTAQTKRYTKLLTSA